MDNNYKDLRTLYSIDGKKHKDTYEKRVDSITTYHLNFLINNKEAFFVENKEINNLTYDILNLNSKIIKLCHGLPLVALNQYSRKCLIDEIVLTNEMEGVHSSRKEINKALSVLEDQSQSKGSRKRFIGIVNSYLKLMRSSTIDLNTCQDIRDLYDEVVLEEVLEEDKDNAPDGQIFRKGANEVKSSTGKILHKGLYPEIKIIEAMEEALSFLNDPSIKHLYRVCLFHYMFEYIHPFYDGNGRIGRLIFSYTLADELERIISFRVSETISENKKLYYNAFAVCNDPRNMGELTPFLAMMLTIIKKSEEDLFSSLSRKEKELNRYAEFIQKTLDKNDIPKYEQLYYVLIQAALFSELGISIPELLTHLNISYVTLNRRLAVIENSNLLLTKKEGHSNYYQLNLAILDSIMMDN